MAEDLPAQIQILYDEPPEDDDTDGEAERDPLAELRLIIEESGEITRSVVEFLTPTGEPDAGCPIHALEQILAQQFRKRHLRLVPGPKTAKN